MSCRSLKDKPFVFDPKASGKLCKFCESEKGQLKWQQSSSSSSSAVSIKPIVVTSNNTTNVNEGDVSQHQTNSS